MTRPAPIIAAVLLLLPVLYVGSYLALMEVVTPDGRHVYRAAWDESSNGWVSTFYRPLEQIDRRLRPAAWKGALIPVPKVSPFIPEPGPN
jgi:hypothetical protein